MISASLGPQVTTLKSKHILLSLPKLESRTALVLVTSHNLLYYDKTFNIVVAQAKNSTEAEVSSAREQQHHEERVLGGSRREGGDPANATAANSLKLLKEQHVADVHGVPNKFYMPSFFVKISKMREIRILKFLSEKIVKLK